MGRKIKMTQWGGEGGMMMVAMCDEVGNEWGRREEGVGCPWIRPRYNLICGSRKQ